MYAKINWLKSIILFFIEYMCIHAMLDSSVQHNDMTFNYIKNDHHNELSTHLSSYKIITVTLFLMVYITSLTYLFYSWKFVS